MPDNIANIELPTNEWVDLYATTGIAVGTALSVENIGVCDVYLAVQAVEPDKDHDAYNVIRRDNGVRVKNTIDDTGAWAFCNSSGGKINVYPTDKAGFYPPVTARSLVDSNGLELILEDNGSVPTTEQDNVSPAVFVRANRVTNETTLAVAAAVGDRTITVADATGVVVGSYVGLFNLATDRFYAGYVAIAPVGNVLTMDSEIDSPFEIGDTVGIGTDDLASIVGTAADPVLYRVRGADPGIQQTFDVTRMMITGLTTNAVNLSEFGDQTALTYGLLIRRVDGTTVNIKNWKDNIGMKGSMFDWESLDDSNPGQGLHGFTGRLTFKKLGVVIRLGPGEELEAVVQDAQIVNLLHLHIEYEGHIAIVGGS